MAGCSRYSQRSLETFKEIGAQDHLVDIYTYNGLAYLGMGNLEEARKWGEDALGLFRHVSTGRLPGQAEDHGRAMRLLGEIMRRIGNFPYAETLLSESAATFQTVGNQLEQGRSLMALARLAKDKGNLATARLMLNEAQLIFQQLGARNDLKKLEALST
jgi:tetratricopeptide (TPR) repeat protein